LQHFSENPTLADKLAALIDQATNQPLLNPNEKNAAQELSSMYTLQKEARDELPPIMQLKLSKEVSLVRDL